MFHIFADRHRLCAAGGLVWDGLPGDLSGGNRKAVQASLNWCEGKARVILSKADTEPYFDQDLQGLVYFPRVHYVYQVAGKVYHGKRIRIGEPKYGCLNKPAKVLARYPSGVEVSVFYDPLNPQDAVLERAAFVPGVYLTLGIILTSLMALILGFIAYGWFFEKQAVLSFFSM